MNSSPDKERTKKEGWLRRNLFSLLMLLFVIVISVAIFYFYRHYPGRLDQLKVYGYTGAFIISLIFNATVVLPAGNILVLAALGATLPIPVLVGVAAGTGAAIGELTGYMTGYSGHKFLERSKMYHQVEGWVKKWGGLIIFLFAMFPVMFDLAGLAAGVLRFPIRKFLLLCWLGRTIFYIGVAYAGAWGWEALLRYLG